MSEVHDILEKNMHLSFIKLHSKFEIVVLKQSREIQNLVRQLCIFLSPFRADFDFKTSSKGFYRYKDVSEVHDISEKNMHLSFIKLPKKFEIVVLKQSREI